MRHATAFSGRLAVGVAALAALAVGLAVGNLAVPVGVAGALAFGWGAGALDADANRRRALGSVATVVGGVAVLAAAVADVDGLVAFTAGALALLGVAAVAVDATAGLGDETLAPVLAALGSSIAAVIGGVALASVLHVAFSAGVAVALFALSARATLSTALGAFLVLQFMALLAGVLMARSRAVVEGWFPDGVPVEAWEEFESLAVSVDDVPRAYWVVLGAQVLAVLAGGVGLVEWLLAATWPFGAAVRFALTAGVLHGAVLLVLLLEAAVLGAELLRRVAVTALSPDPPKSLSYAAGGVALVVLVPVALGVLAASQLLFGVGGGLLFFGGTWGSAAAALSLAVVALGVVFALEVTAVAVAERDLLPDRAAGFALGAALLFAAAVVVVAHPAAVPLVTFAGVAAALVVWDLGETAVDVGSHLGSEAETRRAEVVHATGSLAVGVGGVALAALSIHVVGPLSAPTGGRAVVALGLSLVALVAFALALERRPAGG